jgi:RNA polymerase sigma-70 factor (ECF subfamily)
MPALSEPQIIEKAVSGDRYAFRLLVENHQGFVYGLAYRFLANTADAEDVAQETFIRLWKNLARYKPEVKITTWLYKITTNLCLDHLRSKHAKQSRFSVSTERQFSIGGGTSADQPLIDEELAGLAVRMAEELTPKQKAVFLLRDIENLEVSEVCEILTTSPGNVKSNLYYARVRISGMLNKYYAERKPEKL